MKEGPSSMSSGTSLACHHHSHEKKVAKQSYRSVGAGTLLAPVPPVLVSCGRPEEANLITLAWAGTVNTKPPMVALSLRPERYSHALFDEEKKLVIHMTDEHLLQATDFCGVKSGREINKWEALGLAPISLQDTYPPAIQGAPLALLAEVRQRLPLGSHDCFLAEIQNAYVREDLLDEKGAVLLHRAKLCAYAHGNYYALGKWLGFFGFSVAKPEVFARRARRFRSKR